VAKNLGKQLRFDNITATS